MPFFETFSQRRERAARAGKAEVYTHDGYQIVEGALLRLDSPVVHEEMVKPALVLLEEANLKSNVLHFLHGFSSETLKPDTLSVSRPLLRAPKPPSNT
ncbi:hypothetical protein BH10PSE6_BH10PSE6_08510 [soil metagenome]